MWGSERFHIAVAILIAAAIPLGVWWVNGILPFAAVVFGAVIGFAYWYWRPIRASDLSMSGSR